MLGSPIPSDIRFASPPTVEPDVPIGVATLSMKGVGQRPKKTSTSPTRSVGGRPASAPDELRRETQCEALAMGRGEDGRQGIVVPFGATDERFLDYLIDEAIRAWAANSKG